MNKPNNVYAKTALMSEDLGYCSVTIYTDGTHNIEPLPGPCKLGENVCVTTDKTAKFIELTIDQLKYGNKVPNIAGAKVVAGNWN